MFYRFNKAAGRLVSSAQQKAMLPQRILKCPEYKLHNIAQIIGRSTKGTTHQGVTKGLKPAASESVPIYYDSSIKFAEIPVQEMRVGLAHGGFSPFAPLNERLRQKMIQFQEDNGVPVHLKGGTSDQILFGVTTLLLVICMFQMGEFFYTSAYPPKKDC